MSQDKRTVTKTIESYERMRSSVNGNPRFRFTFTDGTILDGMSDASWAYAVGNRDMREGSTVDMTLSRAGKIRTMRPATER
jgi:hypothetical protein